MTEALFSNATVDMAILQPSYPTDFYENGFNTTDQNAELARRGLDFRHEKHGDRGIAEHIFRGIK